MSEFYHMLNARIKRKEKEIYKVKHETARAYIFPEFLRIDVRHETYCKIRDNREGDERDENRFYKSYAEYMKYRIDNKYLRNKKVEEFIDNLK